MHAALAFDPSVVSTTKNSARPVERRLAGAGHIGVPRTSSGEARVRIRRRERRLVREIAISRRRRGGLLEAVLRPGLVIVLVERRVHAHPFEGEVVHDAILVGAGDGGAVALALAFSEYDCPFSWNRHGGAELRRVEVIGCNGASAFPGPPGAGHCL